ncbi:MAG TPA: shikimate kinase, partial [Bacteroidia bacterium]|nr:shikimate kinase [Bacteroidia bacterium]
MRIFLIGFMGVGKTTIGKKVAAALHIPFLDLDSYIAQQQNMSVADIFHHFGEDYFRMCESKCLQETTTSKSPPRTTRCSASTKS